MPKVNDGKGSEGEVLTDDDRGRLLEIMNPVQWNLVAELFDNANFPGRRVEDAFHIRGVLRSLIQSPAFEAALKEQARQQAAG
jgi:hypothetical protein